ncbi:MAG: penicillin acylase family protein [Pedosphaera sp.]|nr:penicillin acylase family protein [Pedosphaera sp.]
MLIRWPGRKCAEYWVRRLAFGIVVAAMTFGAGGCFVFRRSLPVLEGERVLPGLSGEVRVERDADGIPTLVGSNRLDVARALGFLHGQDRFFQMDLFRRGAAGELSELLGGSVLELDKMVRRHDLRHVAEEAVARLIPSERELLEVYAAGVNAGLNSLRSRPPEYLLLGHSPRPWSPKDSILNLHAMGLFLSDAGGESEVELGTLQRTLAPAAFEFFVPRGTSWDAALDGSLFTAARIPSPAEFTAPQPTGTNSVRTTLDQLNQLEALLLGKRAGTRHNLLGYEPGVLPSPTGSSDYDIETAHAVLGSNAFVVNGDVTGTGSALIGNDMHLQLRLPHLWYRARMAWGRADGSVARLCGATLPGSPVLTIGSNGDVAWGFTASALDTSDVIDLERSTNHPGAYRIGDAWKPFGVRHEIIRVRGKRDVVLDVQTTEWGPVLVNTNRPGSQVIKWVMHSPEAANLGSMAFETARTTHELLEAAPHAGLPWLNVLAGDRQGHIGWTVAGYFPRRVGFDGVLPGSWANGQRRWDGWIPVRDYPRIEDPPGGRLWSANNRHTADPLYENLGRGTSVDLGARALQIRDGLRELHRADPASMLAIQLDDRAIFLERWQKLMLTTLDRSTSHVALRDEVRGYVTNWGAHASTNSHGYRLVRAFRNGTLRLLFEPVAQTAKEADPHAVGLPAQFEEPAWTLLSQRPQHLLNRRFATFDALLDFSWQDVLTRFPKPPKPLATRTWGDRNVLRMQHPFSVGFTLLRHWLDAPAVKLPGDIDMPRVQFDDIGASQRMAVSPGREEDGYYHQPGGASGHFLSPYYLAGHQAWVNGELSKFLPGECVHRMVLRPTFR